MDASPLILILTTALALPPGADIEPGGLHRTSEVRRLDRAKAWLHDHWAQQVRALEESESCISQARSWGEVGICARIAQQRGKPGDSLQATSVRAVSQDSLGPQESAGSH